MVPIDQIEISIHTPEWKKIKAQKQIKETLTFLLAHFKCPPQLVTSILLTNDEEIKMLNQQYRQKDRATNVLSFPSLSSDQLKKLDKLSLHNPVFLGDIVLSYETIKKEAEDQGKPFNHHLSHLLVHGFLHLLGYDHETEEEAHAMEALEIELLYQLNIKNPYE